MPILSTMLFLKLRSLIQKAGSWVTGVHQGVEWADRAVEGISDANSLEMLGKVFRDQ
jgi:hypothetical protein